MMHRDTAPRPDRILPARMRRSDEGVVYLSAPGAFEPFEKRYMCVREKERRLLPDAVVKELPSFADRQDPLYREWQIRARSAEKLVRDLKQRPERLSVLDMGCGNGWLAGYLGRRLDCRIYGLDVNEFELRQAARVFGHDSGITFIYGDVFDNLLPAARFDIIVLASTIQYFQDLPRLVLRLLTLLRDGGEIHIMDSPLYSRDQLHSAGERTRAYYASLGEPEMAAHYHHHAWDELRPFEPVYLYKPGGRLRRRAFASQRSPFPWVKLTRRPSTQAAAGMTAMASE